MKSILTGMKTTLTLALLSVLLILPLNMAIAAPFIDSIDPTEGFQGDINLPVNIYGSGFVSGAQVFFQNPGIIVGPVFFINSTQLQTSIDILIMAPTGPGTVFVINPDTTQNALVNGFTVYPSIPPAPETVIPSQAYQGDSGVDVSIFGQFMASTFDIDFGQGITVDSINDITDTQVDATISIAWDAVLGLRNVVLMSNYGNGTITGGFEVLQHAPPVITGIDPTQLCRNVTNEMITVYGSGFLSGIDFGFIPFGNIVILDVMYVSENQCVLTVNIPASATVGFYDIGCMNPDSQTEILPGAFEVLDCAPDIAEVIPNQGVQGDTGLAVSITGKNLQDITSVDFGSGITVNVLSVTADQIDVTLDIEFTALVGFRDVSVDSPWGMDTLVNGFEVMELQMPYLLECIPDQAVQGTVGLSAVVTGGNLDDITGIDFGSGILVSLDSVASNQLGVTLDIDMLATPGPRTITAFYLDGQTELVDGFTVTEYQPPDPTITLIIPDSAYQGTIGLNVDIEGTNFADGITADFGSGVLINSVIYQSVSVITVNIDIDSLATPGPRDVTVQNPIGNSATAIDGFTVLEQIVPGPQVENVDPDQATQGDILDVTVYGADFDELADVDFSGDGITVSDVTFISSGELIAGIQIDMSATPGARDVTVTNGDLQFDTLVAGFTVLELQIEDPVILSIFPDQGYQGDTGLSATITGQYFLEGLSVEFGDPGITVDSIDAVSVSFIDITFSIAMSVPPGPVDVTVINPNLAQDTLEGGFTVLELPVEDPIILSIDPDQGYQGDTSLSATISGQYFLEGLSVEFGDSGITVDSIDSVSENLIALTFSIAMSVPPGPVDVTVINPNLAQDTLEGGFTVLELPIEDPIITSIDPSQGYQGDTNLTATISGQYFLEGLTVEFGDPGIIVESIGTVSDSFFNMTFSINPATPPGMVNVTVINPNLAQDTLVDGFEVLELVEQVNIYEIIPDSGYPGDILNFDIMGQGFKPGGIVQFEYDGFPAESFFDITYQVINSGLIKGTMSINESTTPGFYDLRVINPDTQEALLPDAFEVLQQIVPPPVIFSLSPNEICIGDIEIPITLTGQNFIDGLEVILTPQFPEVEAVWFAYFFHDTNTIDLVVTIPPGATENVYDIEVRNPDGQSATGLQLFVIDCGEPQPQGRLEWSDTFLDFLIQVESLSDPFVNYDFTAHLLNSGEGRFDDVVISMTDMSEVDGRVITPEYVEIYPSIIAPFGAGQDELISVIFSIPMGALTQTDENESQSGTFMGSMVATDTVTGESAFLPVSLTILMPGVEIFEVDSWCLQVDLLTPGVPASAIDQLFTSDQVSPTDVMNTLGGCIDSFPLFEWLSYAGDCDGYMEFWEPVYTVSVYPVYPGYSPESAATNPPVWRVDGIRDTFIQYPLSAEQLNGVYVWQVEVHPQANAFSGVEVIPQTPVLSDIWAFCVEGTGGYIAPPRGDEDGNIRWYPESLSFDGAGVLPATAVIGSAIVDSIGPGTEFLLELSDPVTDTSLISIVLDPAWIQYSTWSPLPEFGPAAITFNVNVTSNGYLGPGMNPGDMSLQVYNGGFLLGEIPLDAIQTEIVQMSLMSGDSIAYCPVIITWPWDNPCWEIWLWWSELQEELDDDCYDEWDALFETMDTLDDAENAYDDAVDDYLNALEKSMNADNELAAAQKKVDNLQQKIDSFMDTFVYVDGVGSTPAAGPNHVNYGGVDIYFSDVSMYETVFDLIKEGIDKLTDQLEQAQQELDVAQEAADEAQAELDQAESDLDDSIEDLEAAEEAFNNTLESLMDCLERMKEIRETIAWIEWFYGDCFGNSDGIEEPGSGSRGSGQEPGSGTGDGSGTTGLGQPGETGVGGLDCVICGDCGYLLDFLREAEAALSDAQAQLAAAQAAQLAAQTAVETARNAVGNAQAAADTAQAFADAAQAKLDNFMAQHVFSDYVSGTPATGSNYVNYMGVDIYFSDYSTFADIFELIKNDIKELAEEADTAKEANETAQAALAAAQVGLAIAQANLAAADAALADAQADLAMAELIRNFALSAYRACLEEVNKCRELLGCPPLPDTSGSGGGESGEGDSGGTSPDGDQPGVTQPGGSQPGAPSGLSGGSGTGDCPCGDCNEAWNAYKDALEDIANAVGAYEATKMMVENINAQIAAIQEEIFLLEEEAGILNDYLNNPPSDAWLGGATEEDIVNRINEIISRFEDLTIQLQVLDILLEAAEQNLADAEAAVELAETLADLAQLGYEDCMRQLRECERQNGCPPSEAPGGGSGGGYSVPQPPGGDGEGGSTDGPFGPGSDPFDNPPATSDSDCPCEDCEAELAALVAAESALDDAAGAYLEALDALINAEEAHSQAEQDEASAQAEVDAAQAEVDKIQEKLDNFVDNHVFVSGMGGQPGDGPNSAKYKGVTFYFSDANMLMNVFDLVKKGIDKLAQQMTEAKAKLTEAKNKLNEAKNATAAAQANLATARAAEQSAWTDYLLAYADYLIALDNYERCLEERAQCLEENPDDCSGESLEPQGGGFGQDGTFGKSAGKSSGIPYLMFNLISPMENIVSRADENAQIAREAADLMREIQEDILNSMESKESELESLYSDLHLTLEEAINQLNALRDGLPDGASLVMGSGSPSPDSRGIMDLGGWYLEFEPADQPEIDDWYLNDWSQTQDALYAYHELQSELEAAMDEELIILDAIDDLWSQYAENSAGIAQQEALAESAGNLAEYWNPILENHNETLDGLSMDEDELRGRILELVSGQ